MWKLYQGELNSFLFTTENCEFFEKVTFTECSLPFRQFRYPRRFPIFVLFENAGHILTHNERRNDREINSPFFKNHFHLKVMTFNHCFLLLWAGYFPGYVFLKRFRVKLVSLISG